VLAVLEGRDHDRPLGLGGLRGGDRVLGELVGDREVSVAKENSPRVGGAPKNPARPAPADTETSVEVRMSVRVSAYAEADANRRVCDRALIVCRNDEWTDSRCSSDRTRRYRSYSYRTTFSPGSRVVV
jgi:hypothetical protein